MCSQSPQMHPEINASDAFVVAWLPGSEGGGVADVVFRAADGSVAHDFVGTLSFSWPRDPSQTAVNVGDADYAPQWPVGHGLTYADQGDLAALSEEIAAAANALSRKVYFDGGPVPPWQLYVGNGHDAAVPAHGAIATTRGGPGHLELRTSDRRVQEDARSVAWEGGGSGWVYLRADQAIDLERESNADLVLAFDVVVDSPPTDAVHLQFGHFDSARGSIDITDRLGAQGEWTTIRLRLRCFDDAGADMTAIDMPFLLETEGAARLRFSDVKLVSLADGEAPCS